MPILLLVTDVIIINYFLNQFFYPWESIHLLSLRKGLSLAYMSSKLRFINLLDILLLLIQVINVQFLLILELYSWFKRTVYTF